LEWKGVDGEGLLLRGKGAVESGLNETENEQESMMSVDPWV
jgi:hypothetical protein